MGFEVYDYRDDVRNVLATPQLRSRFMRMEAGFVAEPHSHDLGHEVFLVLEGRAEFDIDGEKEVLGPGQMCVALVDQLHGIRVLDDAPMTIVPVGHSAYPADAYHVERRPATSASLRAAIGV